MTGEKSLKVCILLHVHKCFQIFFDPWLVQREVWNPGIQKADCRPPEQQSWLQPAGLSYSIISPSGTTTIVKNGTYFVVFHPIIFFMSKQCCVHEKSSLGGYDYYVTASWVWLPSQPLRKPGVWGQTGASVESAKSEQLEKYYTTWLHKRQKPGKNLGVFLEKQTRALGQLFLRREQGRRD